MAKIGYSFFFLIVLASVGGMIVDSVNVPCKDNLGSCAIEKACNLLCKSKRGNAATGLCDMGKDAPLCICFYTCPSPLIESKPKTCNDGLGTCSNSCSHDCCNQKCAQKHTGGKGFCDNSASTVRLCQCQYPC